MMRRPGVRAVLIHQPWSDSYDVLLGGGGPHSYCASGVGEDGRIVYKEMPENEIVEPFLKLDRSELEALARAILEQERPEDATLDALKDARSVRDRLLAMIEQKGIR